MLWNRFAASMTFRKKEACAHDTSCLCTQNTSILIAMAPPANDSSRTPAVPLAKIARSFLGDGTSSSSNNHDDWIMNPNFLATRTSVGRSFAGTATIAGEPLFDWMFQHFAGATYAQREDFVRFVMSYFVAETIRKGGIVFARCYRAPPVVVDGTTTTTAALPLASVVMVREYDAQRETSLWTKIMDTIHETIMTIRLAVTDGFPSIFTDPKFKETGRIGNRVSDDFIKQWKASHVTLMPHKHWYVAIVGTDPTYHRTGQSSMLLQRITQMADQAGVDCYLESNGPNNTKFYEKFGFKVHGSYEIPNLWDPNNKNKGDTMTTYYMIRRCNTVKTSNDEIAR
jgi:ribosomal protein S18 acetylase RimI-like enzyme